MRVLLFRPEGLTLVNGSDITSQAFRNLKTSIDVESTIE